MLNTYVLFITRSSETLFSPDAKAIIQVAATLGKILNITVHYSLFNFVFLRSEPLSVLLIYSSQLLQLLCLSKTIYKSGLEKFKKAGNQCAYRYPGADILGLFLEMR